MTGLELIVMARDQGARLELLPPATLRIHGGTALEPELVDALRAAKAAVLEILTPDLADYLRMLDLWEPHGPRDLPPAQPFAWTDPNYGPAWALWWAAIDRRNRQFRSRG